VARCGLHGLGQAVRGMASQVRRSSNRRGQVRYGLERRTMVGPGAVWGGEAWHGKFG